MAFDRANLGARGKRKGPHYEKRLKAAFVKSAPPGRHTDGGGLFLVVSPSGARRWLLRLTVKGKRRDFGLGSAVVVSLADPRERAHEHRVVVCRGGDPREALRARAARTVSFQEAAETYHVESIVPTSRNGKHTDQWLTTLRNYAFPIIGERDVAGIISDDILAVLWPIWLEKKETARRVLQRMGIILDWTIVKGYRTAQNPTSGVRTVLPRQKIKVTNFAAMNWEDVPDLMRKLARRSEIGARALRFTVMTVLRSGTVRRAEWSEFDDSFQTWTIPAAHMKADRDFQVPLPHEAALVLRKQHRYRDKHSTLVFPSPLDPTKPLSENTMSKLLKNYYPNATVHGMRSAFRDWAEIFADARREVKEAALAHENPNKVETAYLRTQYYDERETLMGVWGLYLSGAHGDYEELLNRFRVERTDPNDPEWEAPS